MFTIGYWYTGAGAVVPDLGAGGAAGGRGAAGGGGRLGGRAGGRHHAARPPPPAPPHHGAPHPHPHAAGDAAARQVWHHAAPEPCSRHVEACSGARCCLCLCRKSLVQEHVPMTALLRLPVGDSVKEAPGSVRHHTLHLHSESSLTLRLTRRPGRPSCCRCCGR